MIEVRNLTRRFGPLTAIDDISFSVQAGETLGFLGPNGAGKSTTMKMITGFLVPSGGTVSVFGFDIERETLEAQRRIGYLPEGAPCYEEMNPAQFLRFIAAVRGFRGREATTRIDRAVQTMELESVLGQKIETLSKGFKRRVGLAQALLHDPDVLILDEPTDGLDPNQKHQVRELIRGLSREKIVIISTHILEEVTAVCTRAVIISSGRILSDCTPAELQARSRYHHAVTLELSSVVPVEEALRGIEGVTDLEIDDSGCTITLLSDGTPSLLRRVSDLAEERQWPVASVYVERGRLDDVFRSITQGAP